jgi:hypothetical protein
MVLRCLTWALSQFGARERYLSTVPTKLYIDEHSNVDHVDYYHQPASSFS